MPSRSRAERSPRLLCVSVDLDEVYCYSAIHALSELPAESAHAVYRKAVPRLAALFSSLSLPATFFAVGKDLADPQAQRALAALAAAGHEIGNHSHDHHYDLTRRSREEQRAQVALGADAIERAVGVRPVGFRAPGYTVTDTLLDVLQELSVRYDSSVFPCPAYYAAKLAAISGYRALGRRSHSIVDHPRVLRAPADPYRTGTPYTRRGRALLELPIGVTRAATGRLPFYGTSVIMAGAQGARWLCRAIAGRPLVNLELHGLDAADARQDGLQALQGAQPDLRKSAAEKLATLETVITCLRAEGYELATLAQAAEVFADAA
jgi:peptidoglycan/xylan/chitin deacetylase (PgdA/CDA1 family)